MEFAERVAEWVESSRKQHQYCDDEAKTKNAIIQPFVNNVLGFNVFNLQEVVPERLCSFGPGKTDKVDYGIYLDEKLIMLVECKALKAKLDASYVAQLKQYYAACETPGLIGILTNGIDFHFFADTKIAAQMHTEPFLTLNVDNLDELRITWLQRFTKTLFDPVSVTTTIGERQTIEEIRKSLLERVIEPSDDFVRFIATPIDKDGGGKFAKTKLAKFRPLVRSAIREFLDAYVAKRIPTTQGQPPGPGDVRTAEPPQVSTAAVDGTEMGPSKDDKKTEETQGPNVRVPPKKISAQALATDVKSGLSFDALAEKHELSPQSLRALFKQLMTRGLLSEHELPEESGSA
jgi:predicted type IV restriction endonuclease